MSPSIPTVQSLTRVEFDQLERRGAAGATPALAEATVLDRWRTEYRGWRGRHWAFLDDAHGVLRLHPVNVTRTQTVAA
ncbi:hypothetical protein [Nocardia asiatica]|uniref:hypothetical protein n=1 Tax=Nocardia asiatica TaxID=209252 RepID=UPI0024556B7D|nr:hypothetical protein [Nocardia asiatica]